MVDILIIGSECALGVELQPIGSKANCECPSFELVHDFLTISISNSLAVFNEHLALNISWIF